MRSACALKQIEKVVAPLFESMTKASTELCSEHSTEHLALIREFTKRCHQMALAEARKLGEGGTGTISARRPKKRKTS